MKTKEIFTFAALGAVALLGLGLSRAPAQVPTTRTSEASAKSEAEMRALLRERGSALDKALENSKGERARIDAERATGDPSLKERLEEAIKRGGLPEASKEELEAKRRAQEQLDHARANLSDEAKIRMAQVIVDPPVRAVPVTPPDVPVKPANFEDAQPTQPEKVEIAPKTVINRVRITAAGAAEFDSRTGIAIFTQDVIVEHPSFYLECDELEVHMNQDAKAAAELEAEGSAPAPVPVPAVGGEDAEAAAAKPGGGIDLAIAKGRMVMIKKKSEDGKLQVGHCRYAVFDGATGDIEMRIWPQIQKGNELLKATSESTIIIIKQDGRMSTRNGGVALDADAKEN